MLGDTVKERNDVTGHGTRQILQKMVRSVTANDDPAGTLSDQIQDRLGPREYPI
jgi:hypothetical protein